ncbi:predicted protein [Thalassiosira pseudonana CCMP1335]|uniref:Pectate lyase superfamily protein domain-containing protein n=1 Tax=Thalassiosira pseudonana TaxID=35128 RepID=B5YLS8_THAPS|nr:predicted protein [Thalassiosira pseudonana CCMP1335]ACI64129.1 predicted protein [Thalassiosira pseudonana CCMP1335]|eukprot:g4983.t1 g4983   contig18:381365-383811(+)
MATALPLRCINEDATDESDDQTSLIDRDDAEGHSAGRAPPLEIVDALDDSHQVNRRRAPIPSFVHDWFIEVPRRALLCGFIVIVVLTFIASLCLVMGAIFSKSTDATRTEDVKSTGITSETTSATTIALSSSPTPENMTTITTVATTQKEGEDEPNPPPLPNSMKLFYPPRNVNEIQSMQRILNQYSDPILTREEFINQHSSNADSTNLPDFTHTSKNHFVSQRTALLFAPGSYPNLDFEVGYYTSVLGLGLRPTDVQFINCTKGPHVPALDKFTDRPPNGSGLNTFWRSIENIATNASEGLQYAVSQAAPLRRVHVQTDLNLFDADSWVSGGVAANVVVDGNVNSGGQQQWLFRNAELGGESIGGAWSLVFVGCTGNVPEESSGLESGPSITVEKNPNVRVEKPYLVLKEMQQNSGGDIDDEEKQLSDGGVQYEFELRLPAPTFGSDTSGPRFDGAKDVARGFHKVKLADATIDTHRILQKALDDGKDLVLSPGTYRLGASLIARHPNQVILGLGYATLIAPEDGSPCINVLPHVPGVRIAGVMLEASVLSTEREDSCLLQWGDAGIFDPGDETNPGALSDIFARVGGETFDRQVSTDVMVVIHSGHVYGDNLWLWRADHVKLRPNEPSNFPEISPLYRQVIKGECNVKNGLVVNGSNVTMVGLAVEHTTEDQLVWNGSDGSVMFYQCEFPYDVDQTFAENKYVGYRVDPKVERHYAGGLGIYSNFRDYNIQLATAIVHPESDGIQMRNMFTVKLDNQGMIASIVNGRGPGPSPDSERGHPFRCINSDC